MAQSIDSRSLGGVRTPENKGEKSSRKLRRLQRSGGQVSPDLWRTTQPERESVPRHEVVVQVRRVLAEVATVKNTTAQHDLHWSSEPTVRKTPDQMDRVGRARLAASCGSRDDCLSWNLNRAKQGEAKSEWTTWIHGVEEGEVTGPRSRVFTVCGGDTENHAHEGDGRACCWRHEQGVTLRQGGSSRPYPERWPQIRDQRWLSHAVLRRTGAETDAYSLCEEGVKLIEMDEEAACARGARQPRSDKENAKMLAISSGRTEQWSTLL